MNINRIRNSKKHLIFLLLFIGFLFVSCSSSTKTQELDNEDTPRDKYLITNNSAGYF